MIRSTVPHPRAARPVLLALLAVGLGAGCLPDAGDPASDGAGSVATRDADAAAPPAAAPPDAPAGPPPDSGLASVGPEGQTRIYYQFVDAAGGVRFVERLEDVPEAWRDRVGFVELASPPPLTPAEARRASRPDPGRLAAASTGPTPLLYYADWCGYCRRAKQHLNDRGVAYALRDVDVPAAKSELKAKTGSGGSPVLDVDGRILRGYSSGSYDAFLDSEGL